MTTIAKYNSFWENQLKAADPIDFDGDTLKAMLVTSSYTFSDAHDFASDITFEVTGGNYVAGGQQVTGISVTEAAGTTTVDGNNPLWAQHVSGFTDARGLVFYRDTGTPSTSQLVCFVDFISDKGNVNGDFSAEWNVSGIFTV